MSYPTWSVRGAVQLAKQIVDKCNGGAGFDISHAWLSEYDSDSFNAFTRTLERYGYQLGAGVKYSQDTRMVPVVRR